MKKFSQVKLSDEFVVNMGTVLGKGSTGCVYDGKNLHNNTRVAVKVIDLDTIDNEVTKYLLKMQQTAIMILRSPFVLKGLKVVQDQKYCFMVTEFCNGGTLKKYIKDKGLLNEKKSLQILESLLQGYQNLVDRQVVHRDLKPANIMMHNDSPKIIDFGYCQISGYQKPSLEYNVGSPSYMAPQSFQHNIYNQKTEIWSFGVILFECLTGKTIDQGKNMSQTFKILEKFGIPFPDHVSRTCRQIINWCLQIEQQKRPTCFQLLNKIKFLKRYGIEQQNTQRLTVNQARTLVNQPSKLFQTFSIDNLNNKDVLINCKGKQDIQAAVQLKYLKNVNQKFEQKTNKYVQNRMRTAFSTYQQTKTPKYVQFQPQNKLLTYQRQNNVHLTQCPSKLFRKQNIAQNMHVQPVWNPTQNQRPILATTRFSFSQNPMHPKFQLSCHNKNISNPFHSTQINQHNKTRIVNNQNVQPFITERDHTQRNRMASYRY